jgi:predicted acyltransferase
MSKTDLSEGRAAKSNRLLSVDALRGFDMLLISGGGTFIALMEGKSNWPWVDALARQLEHPAWFGFTFYDFIFPLFLFISGVSIAFSLNRDLRNKVAKTVIYRKALWRMIILIVLGILDKNVPFPFFEPSQIRLGSVLGRIGIAGFLATVLYLNFSWKGLLAWIGGILLTYYALLFLVPVPGYGAGNLSFEGNLVGWIDRTFLPGRLLQKTYDELGLLTQLPALCLAIFGTLAGDVLRSEKNEYQKIRMMSSAGIACIAIALLWSFHFPIGKRLWSSSFIMLTSGMAFLFMTLFYWIIDVLKYQKWAFFFQVIGLNSLTVYLAYRFIDFGETSKRLFSGLYAPAPEPWHEVFEALGAFVLVWLFLYFLYRNKIFVKI